MSNEEFTTASRGTMTVEHAELGAELWPGVSGTLAVLRVRGWQRQPDTAVALIREPHAHGWVIITTDFPPGEDWHAHVQVPSFAGPQLSAWLDERTGGVWYVTGVPGKPTLHTHRYSGQSLQHDHPQGDRPHGYFGHREDSGTAHVTGKVDG